MTSRKLGFIGTGRMGGPMAARLLDAGHSVSVSDRNEPALAPIVARGGRRKACAAEVASQAEIVLASLPTPDIVETVALGEDGVIHGTAGVEVGG